MELRRQKEGFDPDAQTVESLHDYNARKEAEEDAALRAQEDEAIKAFFREHPPGRLPQDAQDFLDRLDREKKEADLKYPMPSGYADGGPPAAPEGDNLGALLNGLTLKFAGAREDPNSSMGNFGAEVAGGAGATALALAALRNKAARQVHDKAS